MPPVQPANELMVFVRTPDKANFPMAPAFLRRGEEEILDLKTKRSPLIAGYDCPPGSAIFFTEALCQCAPAPSSPRFVDRWLSGADGRWGSQRRAAVAGG